MKGFGERNGPPIGSDVSAVRLVIATAAKIPKAAIARTLHVTATIPVAADWNLADVRTIGLLQERRSRRIIGAGAVRARRARRSPSSRPPQDEQSLMLASGTI